MGHFLVHQPEQEICLYGSYQQQQPWTKQNPWLILFLATCSHNGQTPNAKSEKIDTESYRRIGKKKRTVTSKTLQTKLLRVHKKIERKRKLVKISTEILLKKNSTEILFSYNKML